MSSIRPYFRDLVTTFPAALIQSWKQERWNGVRLALGIYVFKSVGNGISTRLCQIENLAEATNYLDNFIGHELRHLPVEQALSDGGNVVELGVNIGITARWWLSLSPKIHTTGVDMMEEAIAYTTAKITALNQQDRWTGIVAAVGNERGELNVSFDDPLEGTNSIGATSGQQQRSVRMERLDDLCPDVQSITLLKVDIEGAGGIALEGAPRILSHTRWVVFEIHGDEETRRASAALIKAGFVLDHFFGRTMWWERKTPTA
ncbi:FkbM family methyltransferase [Phragmitibacter flavus]|uniref:FkbM family methyltransferase n=1 Tax=Phragmitibacter flavus TaxID=2576071 RepID=A0A5R8KF30_9BACT|nr:FkbM family methyltransferase [Phragmitibacter flavus]TLD70904.1 FkbM family methyltransferase [Phragmitibacter flavus]